MTRYISSLVIALFFGSLPTGVRAHLDMTSPVERYSLDVPRDADLKTGPCGRPGGERSENINYFEPGETIDVEWNEYVDHPSHYCISFDEDGDDDFVDPATMQECDSNGAVLLERVDEEPQTGPLYSVKVNLPNVECENCTLRVIQVMYDKRPYEVGGNDIYYQCADLVLRKGSAPPDTDAGTNADAGTDPGTDPGADDSSGCNASPGNTSWLGLSFWLLALVAMWRLAGCRRLPV